MCEIFKLKLMSVGGQGDGGGGVQVFYNFLNFFFRLASSEGP